MSPRVIASKNESATALWSVMCGTPRAGSGSAGRLEGHAGGLQAAPVVVVDPGESRQHVARVAAEQRTRHRGPGSGPGELRDDTGRRELHAEAVDQVHHHVA